MYTPNFILRSLHISIITSCVFYAGAALLAQLLVFRRVQQCHSTSHKAKRLLDELRFQVRYFNFAAIVMTLSLWLLVLLTYLSDEKAIQQTCPSLGSLCGTMSPLPSIESLLLQMLRTNQRWEDENSGEKDIKQSEEAVVDPWDGQEEVLQKMMRRYRNLSIGRVCFALVAASFLTINLVFLNGSA